MRGRGAARESLILNLRIDRTFLGRGGKRLARRFRRITRLFFLAVFFFISRRGSVSNLALGDDPAVQARNELIEGDTELFGPMYFS